MPKDWLRSLIDDEKDAVRQYSSAARDARVQGKGTLEGLFQHIRREEEHHRDELERKLNGKGFTGKAA